MRAIISISFALIALHFAQTSLACDQPGNINIPDGRTASDAEMTRAGQSFHAYMLNMQRYQACLEGEANQQRGRSTKDNKSQIQARENRYVSMHNAASDAMTKTAESFKKAVADYAARE